MTDTLSRFKSDEERTPVYRVVGETFPLLLNIFNTLLNIPNPSLEVAELIKLICKIFWSSIYVRFFLPFSSIKVFHTVYFVLHSMHVLPIHVKCKVKLVFDKDEKKRGSMYIKLTGCMCV